MECKSRFNPYEVKELIDDEMEESLAFIPIDRL